MRIVISFIFICFSYITMAQSSGAVKEADKDQPKEEQKVAAPAVDKIESSGSKKQKSVTRSAREESKGDLRLLEDAEDEAPVGAIENLEQSAGYVNAANSFEYSKSRATEQRTQRTPSYARQAEMEEAVDYFEQNAPNSFEYNYFRYVSGNYDISREGNLAEAERLRPNNSDVHVQYAGYYVITGNQEEALAYMRMLINEGRLSHQALKYADDILRSVPQNGTLITHGFDDSYGVYYMQAEKGVRSDVQLVSLDFMQSEEYRRQLTSKGYKLPSASKIDVNYFAEFCRLNAGRKLAVSMTAPKEYFKPLMSKLYATGLVFEYHTEAFDNFPQNVRLWESGLKKELVNNPGDEKGKQLSANYLPMLLQMRKVYHAKGDAAKVKELDASIDKIGAQCKKYEQVQSLKQAY